MKTCLINQPLGLGDILWVQPIVDHYINNGYTVVYPVGDPYFDIVFSYIKKDNLQWVRESDDFPLKFLYGMANKIELGEDIYLPLTNAQSHNSLSLMIGKYFFAGLPVTDYRDSYKINRDYKREKLLMDTYGLYDDFIIVNEVYGTFPHTKKHDINIQSDSKVHIMSIQQDIDNNFHIFDWIGALENAKEIHTVGTSICYLIDKYCNENEIHLYERRTLDEPRTYNREVEGVYRNPRWIYED
jgi:hypothetical protein